MGSARLDWADIPLARPMDTLHLDLAAGPVSDPAAASMGNPHATFFVDDVARREVGELGPRLEHAPRFPERANIGFAQVLGPDRIRLRVWERGAGLTLACGSGACAALVNAHRRGLTGRRAVMVVDGGEPGDRVAGGRARVDDRAGGDLVHRRDRPGGVSGMMPASSLANHGHDEVGPG